MSSTSPPKTPSKTKPASQNIPTSESTPIARGTGSDQVFDTNHTQEEYKGYLKADLEGSCTIPFDDFLDIAFGLDVNWRTNPQFKFKPIVTSADFKDLLNAYKTITGSETARYQPFNELVNRIIDKLAVDHPSPQKPIVFCRNDHIGIKGSHANRIPDCVVVSKKAAEELPRMGWESMSSQGPKDKPFHWSELLAFVEFKVKGRIKPGDDLTRVQTKPERSKGSRTGSQGPKFEQVNQSDARSKDNSPAPAVASTSSASAGTSLAVDQPSHLSGTGNSRTSQKRPAEGLEVPPKKRTKEDMSPKEVKIQCASYALEMLSYGGLRTHVVSALVTDTTLELLYYDRSKPVSSKPIDFSKDTSSLVAFIYCLQHATPSQWGRVNKITLGPEPLSALNNPRPPAARSSSRLKAKQAQAAPLEQVDSDPLEQVEPHPLRGATLTLQKGNTFIELRLGKRVFVQHALIGRGTCVVHATVTKNCPKDWVGKSIVVKFSFTPKTRTSEGEILSEILSIAKGLEEDNDAAEDSDTTENSDTTTASDVTDDSDITEYSNTMEDADPTADHDKPNHTWVTQHLPDVLHHEVLKLTEEDVQHKLSKYLKEKNESYEDRELQILVMTQLFPVTEVETSDELVHVIRDVFKCYKWLYEHAKVIHRDISLNNIMYRRVDDKIHGVLSDYDLSLFFMKPKPGPSSKQRTGTRPYMAIDLLQPLPTEHFYRHDLESLFYVIVVIVSRFSGGKEIQDPPLRHWFNLAPEHLQIKKQGFIDHHLPSILTPHFQELYFLLLDLKNIFKSGYAAREAHLQSKVVEQELRKWNRIPKPLSEFNERTLGGHVNFDKFEEVLFRPLGPHPDPNQPQQ